MGQLCCGGGGGHNDELYVPDQSVTHKSLTLDFSCVDFSKKAFAKTTWTITVTNEDDKNASPYALDDFSSVPTSTLYMKPRKAIKVNDLSPATRYLFTLSSSSGKSFSCDARTQNRPPRTALSPLEDTIVDFNGNINFLVLGPRCAGKSSFINTVFTASSPKMSDVEGPREVCKAGMRKNGTTMRVDKFKMEIFRGNGKGSIQIVDTFGYEAWRGELLHQTIGGELSPGFRNTTRVLDCYQVKAPSIEDAMHVLVVVVNGNEFARDAAGDSKVAQRLRMFIKLIRAKEYKFPPEVIVAATHADILAPGVKSRDLVKDPEIATMIARLSSVLEIAPENIFPIKSYSSESQRVKELEELALRPIYRGLQLVVSRRSGALPPTSLAVAVSDSQSSSAGAVSDSSGVPAIVIAKPKMPPKKEKEGLKTPLISPVSDAVAGESHAKNGGGGGASYHPPESNGAVAGAGVSNGGAVAGATSNGYAQLS